MSRTLGNAKKALKRLRAREQSIQRAWILAARTVQDAVSSSSIGYLATQVEAEETEAIDDLLLGAGEVAVVIEAIRDSFLDGADELTGDVPSRISGPGGRRIIFRFNQTAEASQRWLTRNSSRFVTNIKDQQREAIRYIVARGSRIGQNPRQTALDIVGRISPFTGRRTGGVIGLDLTSTQYVANANSELRSGDPRLYRRYMRREARDKRFDALIKRKIKAEQRLTKKEADAIAARYSDNLLRIRGERIGRTEALQAFNEGRAQAIAQLVEATGAQSEDTEKIWDASGDQRTRADHREMDGDPVPIDQPFRAPDGSFLMHPGDTSLGASPRQVINCRCIVRYRVDFIAIESRNNP